jgi:phosphatidylglycerophosphatase A
VEIAEKVIGPRQDWKGNIKNHDQNQIVIDETLGMAITYCSIIFIRVELFSWSAVFLYFLGFLYFRLFDIIKIWPTKVFDRMENVFGVMMDDAVAGIYAALALYLSSRLFI